MAGPLRALVLVAVAVFAAALIPTAASAKTKQRKPTARLSGDAIATPKQTITLYASGFPKRTHLGVFIHPDRSEGFAVGSSVSATFSTDDNGRATIQLVFPERFYNCAQGCASTPWTYGSLAEIDVSSQAAKKPGTASFTTFVNGPILTG